MSRVRIAVIIVCLCVGIGFVLTGVAERHDTSKSTGAKRMTKIIYMPFWRPGNKYIVLYQREETLPSGVEMFLKESGVLEGVVDTKWNTDWASRHTYWGYQEFLSLAQPHKYTLFDASGDEYGLAVFLREKSQTQSNLAVDLKSCLKDRSSPEHRKLIERIQEEYYAHRSSSRHSATTKEVPVQP